MQRYDGLRGLDFVVDFSMFLYRPRGRNSCAVRSFDRRTFKTAQYVPGIVAPKVFEPAGFFCLATRNREE